MADTPWQGQSVLIVDDSLVAREQLQGLYQELGMVVAGTAVNGVDALEFLKGNRPDLVSLDINMPEMDGVECYQLLKQQNADQKVAMISWLASDHRLTDALSHIVPARILGAKPIEKDELFSLLQHVYDVAPPEDRLNLEDKDSVGGPGHTMPTYTHKVG